MMPSGCEFCVDPELFWGMGLMFLAVFGCCVYMSMPAAIPPNRPSEKGDGD